MLLGDFNSIYIGDTSIDAVYIGSSLVWPISDGNLMPPLMQGGLSTKYVVVDVPYMVCTSQKIVVTPNTSYLIEFETSYSESTTVRLYYYDASGNMVFQTFYPVQGGVTITVPQRDDIADLFIVFHRQDYANISPQDFTNVKMTQV